MSYLLDANAFIQAKNDYYRFGVCPGFWEWLVEANGDESVFSVEGIQNELTDGEDELATWAEGDGSGLFLPPDAETLRHFGQISQWVVNRDFDEANRQAFLAKADPLLIAHAAAHGGFTVVTQETRGGPGTRRVKIPNVCEAFNVPYMNTFDFLEAAGARFVLGTG